MDDLSVHQAKLPAVVQRSVLEADSHGHNSHETKVILIVLVSMGTA